MSKELVLMDCDGGIDDFLAVILLMRMEAVKVLGIVVTPADCYINSAVSATRKILDLMGRFDVPVAASTVRGINAFPALYRKDSVVIDRFPILNEKKEIKANKIDKSGQDFMVEVLSNTSETVTLMVTGPLTTVATAIEKAPEIVSKIKRIVWMGGAIALKGNVEKNFAPEHDGSAEWNVYWDAIAAFKIWQTSIEIVLCPLDLTNTVPVTAEFIDRLAKNRSYPLSDLAGLCYALASTQDHYYWDVMATTYLDRPEFYRVGELETTIVTIGASQGRTISQPGEKKIKVMEDVDREKFFGYLLKQFAG